MRIYEKYLQNISLNKQIQLWFKLLRNPAPLGYKKALLSHDMELLNNALFQSASIEQAKNILDSGCDHCTNV
jgi:hypothetical protein